MYRDSNSGLGYLEESLRQRNTTQCRIRYIRSS